MDMATDPRATTAYQFLEAYQHQEADLSAFNGSWEALMTALVDSAHVHAEESYAAHCEAGAKLVERCATFADKSAAAKPPTGWKQFALEVWHTAVVDPMKLDAHFLIKCGAAADCACN